MSIHVMKSALAAAMLAGFLAGCGGGGGTPSMDDAMPEPDPEAECTADGGIYEDGACKSAEDLRKEGADAEGKKRDREQAEKDKVANAEALRNALAEAIGGAIDDPTTGNPGTDYFVTVAAAGPTGLKNKDAYKEMAVSIMGKAFNKQYEDEINEKGQVTLDATPVAGTSVGFKYAKAPALSKSGSKTHNVNTATGSTGATFVTPGTYHGVAGTFTCTPSNANTPCSSSIGNDDALTLVGTWTFTPGNPAEKVMDGSAVQYGWWADNLGKDTAEVRVYYGPKDVPANASFNLGGKASYSGDAVGQYAIHRGTGSENDSGAFTANVTLEADFGTDATISGMVKGFKGADGKNRDWMVEMQKATITNGAWLPDTDADGNAAKTIWTMGGTKGKAAGSWRGALYGGEASTTPTAAAGAFAAEYGNIGNMIGAFGTEKDD